MKLPEPQRRDWGGIGDRGRFSSEKQKNEDRNVLIIAEKSIDKNAFII